jgi:putative transposase
MFYLLTTGFYLLTTGFYLLTTGFYLLTTGCQWCLIPKSYPHFRTVYGYFRAFQDDGTWRRVHNRLRRYARRLAGRRTRPTAASVDSQCVKATQMAGVRGYDVFKSVKGRKRHIIVDTLGLLLAVVVTPANVSDTAGAVQLLPVLRNSAHRLPLVWCDGGYFNAAYFNAAFEGAKACGLKLEPVLRPANQKGFPPTRRASRLCPNAGWLSAPSPGSRAAGV